MKTLKELKLTATRLSTRNKKYKDDVHTFLCDMAEFGSANDATGGDVLAKFYASCGGVGSQQKIKAWIEQFTMWKAIKKGDEITFKKVRSKDKTWLVDEGRANPWYSYSSEGDDDTKEYSVEQLVKMAHGLRSRIKKQLSEGKAKITDDPVAFEQVLNAIAAIKAPAPDHASMQ